MESEKITPDKKLNNLLSSCISKSFSEHGRNRKRPFSEACPDDTDFSAVDKGKKRHIDSQDEDAYFERVETYDLMSWFAKPIELSPLVCSRYGWKITEPDMLRCVGCKAVLCGQLPKRADSLIYHECCRKLKDNIKLAHLKSCFWPAYPSPECFSSIPLKDKRKLTTLLISYIENLQTLQEKIPLISFRSIEDKGMTANRLEEIKCTVEKHLDNHDLDNMELSTFCLGVTGWNVIDPKTALLLCHYCRRKVGLWNYKTKHCNDSESEKSSEDSESETDCTNSQNDVPQGEKEACVTEIDPKENVCEIISNPFTIAQENPSNSLAKIQENISDPLTIVKENLSDSITKDNGSTSDSSENVQTSPVKQFDFSQPCIIETLANSENANACDQNICSSEHEKTIENIFRFSQPNVVEYSNVNSFDLGEIPKFVESVDTVCNNTSQNGTEPGEKSIDHSVGENNVIPVNKEVGELANSNQDQLSQKCDTRQDAANSLRKEVSEDMPSPKRDEVIIDTVQNNGKPKRKKMKVVKKDSFDPLEEHRYWCPWINKVPDSINHSPKKISEISQGEKKTVYPWELALQILSQSFPDISFEDSISEHFKHHSPVEGLRQLRNLMKDWSN